MLLKVERLKKHFPNSAVPALQDISFEIHQGEFVVILGLSGAGKSTLIRCLNFLISPSEGEIYWQGRRVSAMQGESLRLYRRSIGMIFQSFHLLGRLSTLTNVLVGRLSYMPLWRAMLFLFQPDDVKLAREALARVGLGGLAARRADHLSGGQKQRVAIARTLVQKPMLILGDEPVASLDPLTSKSVMNLLKSINETEKITMMINLHDVELAKQFATRILGIAGGRIVFDGPPEKLGEEELARIYSSFTRTGDDPNEP